MAKLANLVEAVVADVPELISNLSNISALLHEEVPNTTWVGFYIMKDGRHILGPFQGGIACTEIKVGRGVCGTAVERDETLSVDDVSGFDGYIACDKNALSEIVLPIHKDGEVWCVLDFDSNLYKNYSDENLIKELEDVVKVIEKIL